MASTQTLTGRPVASTVSETADRRSLRLAMILIGIGFLLRLGNAAYRFLNADEALHYLLSVQPSLAATYRATLTTAHPPLLIVFLHYWRMLGHSELVLRLPFVIAGTLFCWIVFCWLRRVTGEATALIALALLLFSPALIVLSAEVRQYPLLLLFCASSLYFLDRAIAENSTRLMRPASLFLYLALLTHYSSLIFAFALGAYALIRFFNSKPQRDMVIVWAIAQAAALALIAFMAVHHISRIKSSGLADVITGTYLRRSILQPGQNPLIFIARSNLRLFHYFFSQAAVGAVALALFLIAIVLLFGDANSARSARLPSNRQLAFLLAFPLVVNCLVAMLKVYPYGGSRHDSYLSTFALSGVAISLARWNPRWKWAKPVAIGIVLAICNLFPTPQGEYIRVRDQNRKLMSAAVETLRSLPPGSTILTDDQGGLLLSYYLCDSRVAQIEEPHFELFMRAPCGDKTVISLDPDLWIFKAGSFPETLHSAQQTYNLAPGTLLWFFQAGWFIDKETALRDELKQYGCTEPKDFGRNMFLCRITAP
jgi:4-amino-4-deoxy-L-arabinose transferase-like glycosyltransferase